MTSLKLSFLRGTSNCYLTDWVCELNPMTSLKLSFLRGTSNCYLTDWVCELNPMTSLKLSFLRGTSNCYLTDWVCELNPMTSLKLSFLRGTSNCYLTVWVCDDVSTGVVFVPIIFLYMFFSTSVSLLIFCNNFLISCLITWKRKKNYWKSAYK